MGAASGLVGGYVGQWAAGAVGTIVVNNLKINVTSVAGKTITSSLASGITGGSMNFSLALVQGADIDQALEAGGQGFAMGMITGAGATLGAHYLSPKQNGTKSSFKKTDIDATNEEITTVQFGKTKNQEYHTFRHTNDLGLNRELVQTSVEIHLKTVSSQITTGKPFNQIIEIGGQKIQYTAFKFPDGTINIGRIHGIK